MQYLVICSSGIYEALSRTIAMLLFVTEPHRRDLQVFINYVLYVDRCGLADVSSHSNPIIAHPELFHFDGKNICISQEDTSRKFCHNWPWPTRSRRYHNRKDSVLPL